MYRTTNLPNTRIEVADALRGIAVAGIILFHAREHFNLYWSGLDYVHAGFGGWEQTVAGALGFLLSGKMYAVFALLFGLSFFIQSDNQAQRGNDFSLRFAWRMILLFGIGLINAAIYNGDVLTYYAVFGLLMIPIGKLPNRWVWVIAALLFIQPLELYQHFSGHTLSLRGIEGMETLYPTLATGTFAQSARASLVYGPISSFAWGLEHGRATQTLLMFVLGMLAGLVRGRVEACLMLGRTAGRRYSRNMARAVRGDAQPDDGDGHRRGGGPAVVRLAGIPADAARHDLLRPHEPDQLPAAIAARNGALLQLGHGALPPRGRDLRHARGRGHHPRTVRLLPDMAAPPFARSRRVVVEKAHVARHSFFRPKNRLLRAIFSCPGLVIPFFLYIYSRLTGKSRKGHLPQPGIRPAGTPPATPRTTRKP